MPNSVISAPTPIVSRPDSLDHGLLMSLDGSLWLYRQAPNAPVEDARDDDDREAAADPMFNVLTRLGMMATGLGKRRSLMQSSYREFHILSTTLPTPFRANPRNPNAASLNREFRNINESRRTVLFGVKLRDTVTGRGFKKAVQSVVGTLMEGGTALEDYETDIQTMRLLFDDNGFTMPTVEQIDSADAWWNGGKWPDTINLPDGDHLHVFDSFSAAQEADNAQARGVSCKEWGAKLNGHGHRVYTLCSLRGVDRIETGYGLYSSEQYAAWAARLSRRGAAAISVRGFAEPGSATREEMRRHRREFQHDQQAAERAGKMDHAEAERKSDMLEQIERDYAINPQVTLTKTRVTVAMDGQFLNNQNIGLSSGVDLEARVSGQDLMRQEMCMCSPVRENPHLKDWPVANVAAAGLADVSVVGDSDTSPVLIGFTEKDGIPSYLNPRQAVDEDTAPFTSVTGSTGSGKTMLLLRIAQLIARGGGNAISVGPKPMAKSPKPVLDTVHGQIVDLSDLTSSEGILDGLRTSTSIEQGVSQAMNNLMSSNPFGVHLEEIESDLTIALRYGADRGARCTGRALQIAYENDVFPEWAYDMVRKMSNADPQFRAFVGWNDDGVVLSNIHGWVHIQVGKIPLNLPTESTLMSGGANLSQRIAVTLVRALVNACVYALQGVGGGTILLDEAWTFMMAGREELDRAGRVCREYGVDIMMFNQKVTEAIEAGISGYFARGLVLPVDDDEQAVAALSLLDPALATSDRIERLKLKATRGSAENPKPNRQSMRALNIIDKDTGERVNIRGTIGFYRDLNGNVAPVEIILPEDFLAKATTSASQNRDALADIDDSDVDAWDDSVLV